MGDSLKQSCHFDSTPLAVYRRSAEQNKVIAKSLYNGSGFGGGLWLRAESDVVSVTCHPKIPADFVIEVDNTRAAVVDASVAKLKDGSHGVIIAVNKLTPEYDGGDGSNAVGENDDEEPLMTKTEKMRAQQAGSKRSSVGEVRLYAELNGQYKCVRIINVNEKITCISVLVSPAEMAGQSSRLNNRMKNWHFIIAIGCIKARCYLSQFEPFDPSKDEDWEEVRRTHPTTDALRAIVNQSSGKLTYERHTISSQDVTVTSLGYIPLWSSVLIGMSFGGVLLVPLDGKTPVTFIPLAVSAPVSAIAVLEPENDPKGGWFIWAAFERSKNYKLLGVFFKVDKMMPDSDGCFEYAAQQMSSLELSDGVRWLALHTVIQSRSKKEGNDTASSTIIEGLNTSQLANHDGLERTLLFYSYLTANGRVKGGIFDLNMLYSRRFSVGSITFNQHGQHPVCSQFTLEIPPPETGHGISDVSEIKSVVCMGATRFSSPLFVAEALFWPMALELTLYIHSSVGVFFARVPSFQREVMSQLTKNLSHCLRFPDQPLALLEYVGLVVPKNRKDVSVGEVSSSLAAVLRAIVAGARCTKAYLRFIDKEADRKQRLLIGRFMWAEVQENVSRLDDAMDALLDLVPSSLLAQQTANLVEYCPRLFKIAEQTFTRIRNRGIAEQDDSAQLRYTRGLHARSALSLRLFMHSFNWFTKALPRSESWTRELNKELAEFAEERRKKARVNGYPLFISGLLSRLYNKTMDDHLWMDTTPDDWYPPSVFNIVSLLRQPAASLADRACLLFYFLMDVDEMLHRELARPDEEKKGYEITQKTMLSSFLHSKAGDMFDEGTSDQVREEWKKDQDARRIEVTPTVVRSAMRVPLSTAGSNVSGLPPLSTEEKAEAERLMASTESRLSLKDEDRLKSLLHRMNYGIYRWNLYLIRKGFFYDVHDLPIPAPGEEYPHEAVRLYAQFKPFAMQRKKDFTTRPIIPRALDSAGGTSMLNTTEDASVMTQPQFPNVTLVRGKTPRRITTTHSLKNTERGSSPVGRRLAMAAAVTPSIRIKKADGSIHEVEEHEESIEANVAPDELARVRDALRTPRRIRENLRKEEGRSDGIQVTPETAPRPPVPPPLSILKSAAKKDRATASAVKSFRFAEVFDAKSISPRESASDMRSGGRVTQPDFDESFDDAEEAISAIMERVDSPVQLEGSSVVVVEEGERRDEAPQPTEGERMNDAPQPMEDDSGEESEQGEELEIGLESGESLDGDGEGDEQRERAGSDAAHESPESFSILHDSAEKAFIAEDSREIEEPPKESNDATRDAEPALSETYTLRREEKEKEAEEVCVEEREEVQEEPSVQRAADATFIVPVEQRQEGVFYMDADGIERSFEMAPVHGEEEKGDEESGGGDILPQSSPLRVDTSPSQGLKRKRSDRGHEEVSSQLSPTRSPTTKKSTTTTTVIEETIIEREGRVEHTTRQETTVEVLEEEAKEEKEEEEAGTRNNRSTTRSPQPSVEQKSPCRRKATTKKDVPEKAEPIRSSSRLRTVSRRGESEEKEAEAPPTPRRSTRRPSSSIAPPSPTRRSSRGTSTPFRASSRGPALDLEEDAPVPVAAPRTTRQKAPVLEPVRRSIRPSAVSRSLSESASNAPAGNEVAKKATQALQEQLAKLREEKAERERVTAERKAKSKGPKRNLFEAIPEDAEAAPSTSTRAPRKKAEMEKSPSPGPSTRRTPVSARKRTASTVSAPEAETPATPTRKRGRPPKVAKKEEEEEVEATAPSATTTPTRRRTKKEESVEPTPTRTLRSARRTTSESSTAATTATPSTRKGKGKAE